MDKSEASLRPEKSSQSSLPTYRMSTEQVYETPMILWCRLNGGNPRWITEARFKFWADYCLQNRERSREVYLQHRKLITYPRDVYVKLIEGEKRLGPHIESVFGDLM